MLKIQGRLGWAQLGFLFALLGATEAVAACVGESDFQLLDDNGLSPAFCARWNPDFGFKDGLCCAKAPPRFRRRGIKCSPKRAKRRFCDEMTDEQRDYLKSFSEAHASTFLDKLSEEIELRGNQSYCEPNEGFLVWGRPVIPTPFNRLRLRRPDRCVNFGTDRMVGMLEWVGRKVAEKFPEDLSKEVLLGDISAPRGGCLMGRGGRRGHASHTNGRDVDLGFLRTRPASSSSFTKKFEPEINWWLLKQVFSNPFACVDVVFLDRRHIRTLRKQAEGDPLWAEVAPHLQHVRGHRNHFHVRIGLSSGLPGCPGTWQQGMQAKRGEKVF